MFFRDHTYFLERGAAVTKQLLGKGSRDTVGKEKENYSSKTDRAAIRVALIFTLGFIRRNAHSCTFLHIDSFNRFDVCVSGMKESLIVLTHRDWHGFVCQCFPIEGDYYLAQSLMMFVYNRPPRKQKSTHYENKY